MIVEFPDHTLLFFGISIFKPTAAFGSTSFNDLSSKLMRIEM